MDPLGPHDPLDSPPVRLADLLDDLVVWFERRRQMMPRLLAIVLVLAVLIAGAWWALRPRATTSIEDRIPMVTLVPSLPVESSADGPPGAGPPATEGVVTVHVAGAVGSPGVYEFGTDGRVIDAVEAAGGPLEGADLSVVNLAAPLVDGSQIRIPLVGETLPVPLVPTGGAASNGGIDGAETVALNQATASDLERLPGVGPATAQAIITWRTNNGPFVTAEQLLEVPGIGPAKFAAMVDQVVVG